MRDGGELDRGRVGMSKNGLLFTWAMETGREKEDQCRAIFLLLAVHYLFRRRPYRGPLMLLAVYPFKGCLLNVSGQITLGIRTR